MKDHQQSRAESAVEEDMDVEHLEGNKFEVKGKYTVDPIDGTCECKDFEYRVDHCKHLIAVYLETSMGNVTPPSAGPTDGVERPQPLVPIYDRVPSYLTERAQWVCWEYQNVSDEGGEKDWTKVPIDVENGGFGSSTDSDTWTTFDAARDYDEADTDRTDGVGFCVDEDDDLIGIDIDDCRDRDTGEIDSAVQDLVDEVGSYCEVSPSGTGLRIFVRGDWPLESNQTDLLAGDAELEVYCWGRYLTVTGYHVDGTPVDVIDDQDTIDLFAGIMDPSYSS
jgi:hypothetical protein